MNKIMKKWGTAVFTALTLCLGFSACADDDAITLNTASIKEAPDFVDARDGHVYHCIQIGDQIWTTENLAYMLPLASADGCVTWDEKQDIDPDSLVVDTANIVVVISDEKYKEIYDGVVNDPGHDWPTEVGTDSLQFHLMFNNFYGEMFTQEQFTNVFVNDPVMAPFGKLLLERLEVQRLVERQDYIDRLTEYKKQIPLKHYAAAEKANGGYVAENGFLYTYEGALKAVPKEGGWRLPSDADWKKLEMTLGMPASEVDNMEAWRGQTLGDALKAGGATGFNALFSGCNGYQRTQEDLFIKKKKARISGHLTRAHTPRRRMLVKTRKAMKTERSTSSTKRASSASSPSILQASGEEQRDWKTDTAVWLTACASSEMLSECIWQ